jgi:predicted O-linked N-acetylglucosamine transferase (SPINDLY family)
VNANGDELARLQAIDAVATSIEQADFAAALRAAQNALQRWPHEAEIWRLLGIAQLQKRQLSAALQALYRAQELAPGSIEILCNIATAELQSGHVENAQRALETAVARSPAHAVALNGLGRLYLDRANYAAAEGYLERALHARPDYVQAWLNLANCKLAQFQFAVAESLARRALNLDPESADGWYLLGYLFERQGKLRDANAAYHRALELRPHPRTAYNLGLVFDQLGDWQQAARMFEQALALDPTQQEALAQLVFVKRRLCDWHDLSALAARLIANVDAHVSGLTPFSFLAEHATPKQQLECARTFARQFAPASLQPHAGADGAYADQYAAPETEVPANQTAHDEARIAGEASRIRVGFVSSGFAQHATGLLIVELIEHLRPSNLHTIAFATTPDDRSEIRRRLVAGFVEFHDVSNRAPHAIAQSIRDANCDCLIDVDGYCMGSIPQIFALRAAPIQINYLAYPGSLGAPWYDYLIADRFVIPAQQRDFYDEKIVWLPRCYQPTDTTRPIADPPPRSICGLPESGFVYCCFNNTWKVTPQSFALWMRILHAVPDSVLWLLDGSAGNGIAGRLRESARHAGIDPQRLIFMSKLAHSDYLARYRHADLFLDTNPYNAHTTASDALYAGCPVLTRPGATFASRVAGSLNEQLGLGEMNAATDEIFVARAIELGQQAPLLAALKAKLAQPESRSRLFDMQAYAQDFAQLLTSIVRNKGP